MAFFKITYPSIKKSIVRHLYADTPINQMLLYPPQVGKSLQSMRHTCFIFLVLYLAAGVNIIRSSFEFRYILKSLEEYLSFYTSVTEMKILCMNSPSKQWSVNYCLKWRQMIAYCSQNLLMLRLVSSRNTYVVPQQKHALRYITVIYENIMLSFVYIYSVILSRSEYRVHWK